MENYREKIILCLPRKSFPQLSGNWILTLLQASYSLFTYSKLPNETAVQVHLILMGCNLLITNITVQYSWTPKTKIQKVNDIHYFISHSKSNNSYRKQIIWGTGRKKGNDCHKNQMKIVISIYLTNKSFNSLT